MSYAREDWYRVYPDHNFPRRTLYGTSRNARQQVNDILISPFRQPHETRQHHFVSRATLFEVACSAHEPGFILRFMRDSRIMEIGTHDELIAQDGAYAHMWKLQAEAFIG